MTLLLNDEWIHNQLAEILMDWLKKDNLKEILLTRSINKWPYFLNTLNHKQRNSLLDGIWESDGILN